MAKEDALFVSSGTGVVRVLDLRPVLAQFDAMMDRDEVTFCVAAAFAGR